MKETVNAILSLLQEFKRDTKSASILIIFGLLVGSLYVVYVQVEEKNSISMLCEKELRACEKERLLEIKAVSEKFERMAAKIDSTNRIKRKR